MFWFPWPATSRQLTHPFPRVSCVRSLVSQLYHGDKLRIIFRLLIAEKEISRVRAGSQIGGLDSRLSIFLPNSRGAFSLTLPSLGIVQERASAALPSDKSVPERMGMAGGKNPTHFTAARSRHLTQAAPLLCLFNHGDFRKIFIKTGLPVTLLDSRTFTMGWGDPWPHCVADQLSPSFAPLLTLCRAWYGRKVS